MIFSCMARLARIVVPQRPHHVTQRGNRREAIFFTDGDHEVYRALLAEQARRSEVEVWAYCLMPNHVHLILVPKRAESLGNAVGVVTSSHSYDCEPGWLGLLHEMFAAYSVYWEDQWQRRSKHTELES